MVISLSLEQSYYCFNASEAKLNDMGNIMGWCARRQAIAWANVNPDLCGHMESLATMS